MMEHNQHEPVTLNLESSRTCHSLAPIFDIHEHVGYSYKRLLNIKRQKNEFN